MHHSVLNYFRFTSFVTVQSEHFSPAVLSQVSNYHAFLSPNFFFFFFLTYFLVAQLVLVNVPMMPYPATKRLKAQAITDAEPYTVIPSADNVTAVIQTCFNNSVPNVSHILDGKWGLAKVYARRLNRQIHPDITSLLFKPRLLDSE
jgi:hypothetical protein